jgi:hypothetical protein
MEEAAAAAAAEAEAAADNTTSSPLSSSLHLVGDAELAATSSTAPSSPIVKRRHMSSLSASVAPVKRRSSIVTFSSSKEATAVAMERIVLPLERLAETHFQGGIRAHHYQSLGDALTHALR